MLNDLTIGFLGSGNMAAALIRGLIATGLPAQQMVASNRSPEKLQALVDDCGIRAVADNASLIDQADVVVLGVKPQMMKSVLEPLADRLQAKPRLLISVAAGIPLEKLTRWTHDQQAVVRCMPNTPSLVGCGASALFANALVTDSQRALAETIMQAVGLSVWLDEEKQMDAVTALSGSGPAYFFLLIEAMQSAAEALGLPTDMARQLALQTALGAGRLAMDSALPADELRRRVTSPGGTTEAAITQFLDEDFQGIVTRAMSRAAARSAELSTQE